MTSTSLPRQTKQLLLLKRGKKSFKRHIMDIYPHGSSGGDGRRPPRDKNRLGVNDKGASKRKSKKRQQRQSRPSRQSEMAERARPVLTAADLGYEDDRYNPDRSEPENTAAHTGISTANAASMQGSAAQPAAEQTADARGESSSARATRPPAPAPLSTPALGSSSGPSPRAGASNSSSHQQCLYCPVRFTSDDGVRDHVRRRHDRDGMRHCFRCWFIAPDRQSLLAHMRIHAPQGTLLPSPGNENQCPYCAKQYSSYDSLRVHVRRSHDTPSVRHCFRCRFTTPDLHTVQTHMRSHSGQRVSASAVRGEIQCPYCANQYRLYDSLRLHVRNSHDTPSVRHCFRCRFTAPDLRTVQTHMRSHSGRSAGASASRSEIQCPYCAKQYSLHDSLRLHVRNSHDTPNVRHCFRCRFTAPDLRTVQTHMRNHSQQSVGASASRSEIQCPYCSRRYTISESLRNHVRNIHDHETARHCFRCSFVATDSLTLQSHMRGTHGRLFRCSSCGNRFVWAEYNDHVKTCRR